MQACYLASIIFCECVHCRTHNIWIWFISSYSRVICSFIRQKERSIKHWESRVQMKRTTSVFYSHSDKSRANGMACSSILSERDTWCIVSEYLHSTASFKPHFAMRIWNGKHSVQFPIYKTEKKVRNNNQKDTKIMLSCFSAL